MIPILHKMRPRLKIMLTVLGVLCFLVPETSLATTQFSDIVYLNGQKHSLDSLPLEQYYGPKNPRPKFRAPNTATWRGYIATWEIDRGVLYLKAIRAWTGQRKVGLEALFPGQKGPVAATWFTGKLSGPPGQDPQTCGAPSYLCKIPHDHGGERQGGQPGSLGQFGGNSPTGTIISWPPVLSGKSASAPVAHYLAKLSHYHCNVATMIGISKLAT